MAVSKMLTNEDLHDFFESEVKLCRRETSKAKKFVFSKVDQLLEFVNKEDLRFGCHVMRVGSSFQGLKTKAPDEFDFNIMLVQLGEFSPVPLKKRYYGFNELVDKDSLKTTPSDIDIISTKVPLPDPPIGFTVASYYSDEADHSPIWQDSTDLIFDGDIIPYLVRKQLKELLLKAIRTLNLRGELRLGRKVHGPALTIRIPYNEDAIEEITIDFAPMIPCIGTLDNLTNWPPSRVRWPSRDKIYGIKSMPLCAIAKEPFDWLISYTTSEKFLLNDIDEDRGCRKKTLRIMKRFREKFWCKTSKPVISSYHLKNILFLECERYPQMQDWEPKMLNVRVKSMTEYLLTSIKKGNLPQYFNRKVNLISLNSPSDSETLDLEKRNIEGFLNNPHSFFSEE